MAEPLGTWDMGFLGSNVGNVPVLVTAAGTETSKHLRGAAPGSLKLHLEEASLTQGRANLRGDGQGLCPLCSVAAGCAQAGRRSPCEQNAHPGHPPAAAHLPGAQGAITAREWWAGGFGSPGCPAKPQFDACLAWGGGWSRKPNVSPGPVRRVMLMDSGAPGGPGPGFGWGPADLSLLGL